MRLEQSFEVPVPVAQAWGVLLDLERIAPCMPGATLTSFDGTAFTGNVKVKLGPVSLAYKGHGHFTERDEAARQVAFVAQGQDSRGAGAASARVTSVLESTGSGSATLVRVVADLDIAGRAAQFGRGMIADVSGKLIKQFADCLAQTIASSPAAPTSMAAASGTSAQASPPVDAAPPPVRPPLTPVFTEPAPTPAATAPQVAPAATEYTPPMTTNSGPPEYHPLALQEPSADTAAYAPPPSQSDEPGPPPPPAPPPSVPAATVPARPAAEAEPIDLLAISGAKSMMRRAAPVLIIVALAVIGLIVWLAVG
jgi:carbon monoxide dehydrogenase subunit G